MEESHKNIDLYDIYLFVDKWIFIKNKYSIMIHLIPFSVAALLLLALSVPNDNLMPKITDILQYPNSKWIPAFLLTIISTIVYFLTIRLQVRKAYLFRDRECRRILFTAVVYILLCGLMAYIVLTTTTSEALSLGGIWTCYLLTILSLTGVGWTIPSDWAESIGINSPDYSDGRRSVEILTQILSQLRKSDIENYNNILDFRASTDNLRNNIEKNFAYEPEWAQDKLISTSNNLRIIIDQIDIRFKEPNYIPGDFAAACRCQKESQYQDFIRSLRELSESWPEWKCDP